MIGYVAYGITTIFFGWIGYEITQLLIGSIKDKKNGKS
jgi:TM2 domain-containing membrane protein YozV